MGQRREMAQKKSKISGTRSTVNAQEIRQFDSLGDKWWDESGPMRPLHKLNPVRLAYIKEVICERFASSRAAKNLQNLKIADIGCGGGLLTEPLTRLGAAVTGVDAGKENIKVAKAHAKTVGLEIEYLATTAEALAATGRKFDIVTALEIVEHVDNVDVFIKALAQLVKPGGLLIMSTPNRTPKSYMLGIIAAEYILRWLPVGTHDWKKFMKPSELAAHITANGLDITDIRGMTFNPLANEFALSKTDVSVNYLMTAVK